MHDGLKRVDITLTNYALSGFFKWLSLHYPCPYVFIECKNFGEEIGNPEIDQIAMRLGERRGKFGIVVCRKVDDRPKMLKRCRAVAQDEHGYILVLDDDDPVGIIILLIVCLRPRCRFCPRRLSHDGQYGCTPVIIARRRLTEC